MKIKHEMKLDFSDVLIRPNTSIKNYSRGGVDVTRTFKFCHCKKSPNTDPSASVAQPDSWTGVPIMAANMSTVGTFDMARVLRGFGAITALHKHYTAEEIIKFYQSSSSYNKNVFVSIGATQEDLDKLIVVNDFFSKGLNNHPYVAPEDMGSLREIPWMINIDVANGHNRRFINHVKKVREMFPYKVIMAGNVATTETTQELLTVGADIVKIGIGGGSVCTTRIKTGVGVPQLSAIADCTEAAHQLEGLVCGDGGCVEGGDVCKAFGAGADFVMLGGMLAGTDECEGEWIEHPIYEDTNDTFTHRSDAKVIGYQKVALEFYGMASQEAQDKYTGGVPSYGVAEGKSVQVPYKGPADKVIQDILGGLRTSCGYVGTDKLKNFSKCCTFQRCSNTHNRVYE